MTIHRMRSGFAAAALGAVLCTGFSATTAHAAPVVASSTPVHGVATLLTITAHSNAYQGSVDAQVGIRVRGQLVGVVHVTSTTDATYTVAVPQGVNLSTDRVDAAFMNDGHDATGDRNLWLKSISDGVTTLSVAQADTYDRTNDPATDFWAEATDGQNAVAPQTMWWGGMIEWHAHAPLMGTAPNHGSLPAGQAAYAVPDNAIHVSTSGNDANPGTASQPKATVTAAIAAAGDGGTVVVHGGTYHQSLGDVKISVTIENAPGEAVTFDGSESMTGFTQTSAGAWAAPYSYEFSSNPTYTGGVDGQNPNGTGSGWTFVNSAHPMAGHPDQVWIDGTKLTEVGSEAQVSAGTFYVDHDGNRLVVGTNPAGHDVRAATLSNFATLDGTGTVLRGFDVKNYANTQRTFGMIADYAPNTIMENLNVTGAATGGIGVFGHDASHPNTGTVLNHVSVDGAGMTDVEASLADGLTITHSSITGANSEKFNFAPAAAGVKVSRTNGVTITDSAVDNNYSTGVWTDEDARRITVARNEINNNAVNGVMIELGTHGQVVDNTIIGNGAYGKAGVFLSNTNNVDVVSNTIDGAREAVYARQDTRTPKADHSGVGDTRAGNGAEPDATWVTQHDNVWDNVLVNEGAGTGSAPDGQGTVSNWGVIHAEQATGVTLRHVMFDAVDGNTYALNGSANAMAVVSYENAAFRSFKDWASYRVANPGLDAHSAWLGGMTAVSAAASSFGVGPVAVPAADAALMASGSAHVGSDLAV